MPAASATVASAAVGATAAVTVGESAGITTNDITKNIAIGAAKAIGRNLVSTFLGF